MQLSVLHVSQPVIDGVAVCVADLAAAQRERGWRVGVACPPNGPLTADARAAGAEVHPWPATRTPTAALAAELRRLRTIVGDFAPDVVHLHSSKAGLAGRLVVRARRPTLFQPHAWSFAAADGTMAAAARRWERLAARWTTALVCCSQAELDEGLAAGVRARGEVVPNAVPLDVLTPAGEAERASARERLGIDDRTALAVCIGRLSRQKGQDRLVDVWPSVRAAVAGAELVLLGEGPEHDALARRAPPGVTLAGRRSDVADWLAAADVVAAPSRYEGLSLALLEAMARGRSVVATDAAGMREALGSAGAVVAQDDAGALVDALVARLSDADLAAAEGRAGRARAEAHHDLHEWAARLCELTASVASGGAGRA